MAMTREEAMAAAQKRLARKQAMEAAKARLEAKKDPPLTESYVGQGVAGINEGMADLAGTPVDMVSSLFRDISPADAVLTAPLLPFRLGANAVRNTLGMDEPVEPVGGSDWIKRKLAEAGAIPPSTGESGKDLVRSIGREIGAAAPMAAGLYARGANLAGRGASAAGNVIDDMARAAYRRPAALAAAEAGSSVGAGVGEAAGQSIGGDTGGIVGRLVGGMGGGMVGGKIGGDDIDPRGMSEARIRETAGGIYDGIRQSGRRMPGRVATYIADSAEDLARREGWLRPDNQWNSPRVRNVVGTLRSYESAGMSFDDFQRVRQSVIDDAISKAVSEGGGPELRALQQMREHVSALGAAVWPDMRAADELWSRASRHRDLVGTPMTDPDEGIGLGPEELARISGDANYSQAGVAQARQRGYANIAKSLAKGRDRNIPVAEQRVINDLATGTPGYRAAKWTGKFAPTSSIPVGVGMAGGGNVGLATGFMTGNPVLGMLAGAGTSAGMYGAGAGGRQIAKSLQGMKVNELSELIRTGRYGGPRYLSDIDRAIGAYLAATSE